MSNYNTFAALITNETQWVVLKQGLLSSTPKSKGSHKEKSTSQINFPVSVWEWNSQNSHSAVIQRLETQAFSQAQGEVLNNVSPHLTGLKGPFEPPRWCSSSSAWTRRPFTGCGWPCPPPVSAPSFSTFTTYTSHKSLSLPTSMWGRGGNLNAN